MADAELDAGEVTTLGLVFQPGRQRSADAALR